MNSAGDLGDDAGVENFAVLIFDLKGHLVFTVLESEKEVAAL